MTYTASYTTNNGSTYAGGFEYTNKREAIKSIREICAGETFVGNVGRVRVVNEDGESVYDGSVR